MHATVWTLVLATGYFLPFYFTSSGNRNAYKTDTAALLGLHTGGLAQAIALPLLLTATLFTGPLLHALMTSHRPHDHSRLPWYITLRNYVAAPISEEWVFRACMAPLWLQQGFSSKKTIFLLPLAFGVAHMHHLHNLTRHQGVAVQYAVLQVSFQFCYTYIFGVYATFLLLRTGHIAALVVAHAFCNIMGLPAFDEMCRHKARWLLMGALVGGIATFCALLYPLTEGQLYGCKGGLLHCAS